MNIMLYEIASEYQYILSNFYDPETGEVDETSLAKMNDLKESLEKKCVAVACYIENVKAECQAISEAKKKMAEREAKVKKQLESLKEYLLYNMEKSELKKVTCPYFDISIRKNPPAVEVYDESAIPLDYDRVEIKKDTAKMRQDMLNGIEIPGARLTQKNSVSIR
jgi:hypothetical protein